MRDKINIPKRNPNILYHNTNWLDFPVTVHYAYPDDIEIIAVMVTVIDQHGRVSDADLLEVMPGDQVQRLIESMEKEFKEYN